MDKISSPAEFQVAIQSPRLTVPSSRLTGARIANLSILLSQR